MNKRGKMLSRLRHGRKEGVIKVGQGLLGPHLTQKAVSRTIIVDDIDGPIVHRSNRVL